MSTEELEFNRAVGRRVRAARRRANLTQQELADEVELARTSITNIENGNQTVSVWLVHRLAVVTDCNVSKLLPSVEDATMSTPLPSDVPSKTAELIRRLGSAR